MILFLHLSLRDSSNLKCIYSCKTKKDRRCWSRNGKQQPQTVQISRYANRDRQVFHVVCPRQRSRCQRRTEMSVRVQCSALLAPPWLTVELPPTSTAGGRQAHTIVHPKQRCTYITCTHSRTNRKPNRHSTVLCISIQYQTIKFSPCIYVMSLLLLLLNTNSTWSNPYEKLKKMQ